MRIEWKTWPLPCLVPGSARESLWQFGFFCWLRHGPRVGTRLPQCSRCDGSVWWKVLVAAVSWLCCITKPVCALIVQVHAHSIDDQRMGLICAHLQCQSGVCSVADDQKTRNVSRWRLSVFISGGVNPQRLILFLVFLLVGCELSLSPHDPTDC